MQVQSLGLEDPLDEGMATHSSTLAWKIPWMEEPGRLPSMGSHRVRHDKSDSSSSSIEICILGREKGMATWRREWLPTAIFLPGASHGQRSLAGYI